MTAVTQRRRISPALLSLVLSLTQRDIVARYRGSALGLLWSLITPLLMLGVYTFVFGTVFKARWAAGGNSSAVPDTAEYALILFSGLTVFQILGEIVNRSPRIIIDNANYVKKIVFPLEILPIVACLTALFNAAISFCVLVVFVFLIKGGSWTMLLVPLILLPYPILLLGLSWLLAAFGTYVRDVGQILGSLVTALMFMSPIFFPKSALPDWLQPLINLNPATLPIEQVRNALIFGTPPDWAGLGIYTAVALLIATLGYQFFQATRRGFADVL